jgi:hypothetical protein
MSKAQVWHGTVNETPGGNTKSDLMQKRDGRIVSKAKRAAALHNPGLRAWGEALMVAMEMCRKDGTSTDGFTPIRKGTKEYKMVREIYDRIKSRRR